MDINKYLFDRSREYSKPPVALSLNGDIWGTLGNFSLVTGKAKSKKTFLMSILLASATNDKPILNIQSELDNNNVVYFDTEQGNYHISLVDKRISKLRKKKNTFDIYKLREACTQKRLEVIEQIINSEANLGIVVIDGVRDLVSDINNAEEATKISNKLLQWSAEKDIHIVVVLHQNKGDKNARGHLGTELQNKAETVVNVTASTSNKDISTVEVEYSRNQSFDSFAFRINEQALPELIDIEESIGKKPSLNPQQQKTEVHYKVLKEIFKQKKQYSKAQLKMAIQTEFHKILVDFGDSKARDYVDYYDNCEYIVDRAKGESLRNRKKLYEINSKFLNNTLK